MSCLVGDITTVQLFFDPLRFGLVFPIHSIHNGLWGGIRTVETNTYSRISLSCLFSFRIISGVVGAGTLNADARCMQQKAE
jgi:hypothetical protein